MTLYSDAVDVLNAWPGTDPLRHPFLELLASSPESVWASHPGAHLTASALIVHPDLRQVLLCLHARNNLWMQVGGHCEPGDNSLLDAALREATEESGLSGLRPHPDPIDLDIHYVNCRHGGKQHFDVRYAVLAAQGTAETLSDESRALGWFDADRLPSPLAPSVKRLVPLALKVFSR